MRAWISLFLALSSALGAKAAVFEQAGQFAEKLLEAALQLEGGRYMLQSVATGQYLAFDNSRGHPDFVLKKKGTPVTLRSFGPGAFSLGLGPSDDSDRYCLSSQWSARDGFNIGDTAYFCCDKYSGSCDNGGNQGALRTAKQAHLIVPSSSSAIAQTSRAVAKLDKRAMNLFSEEEDFEGGRHLEARGRRRRKSQRHHKSSTKFRGQIIHIVAVDHLHDMAQRSVSAKVIRTAGGYRSLALSVLDANDKYQQWRLVKIH